MVATGSLLADPDARNRTFGARRIWPGADCLPLVKGYAWRTLPIRTCEAGAGALQASGWRIPLRSAAVRRRWAFFLRWFVPMPL